MYSYALQASEYRGVQIRTSFFLRSLGCLSGNQLIFSKEIDYRQLCTNALSILQGLVRCGMLTNSMIKQSCSKWIHIWGFMTKIHNFMNFMLQLRSCRNDKRRNNGNRCIHLIFMNIDITTSYSLMRKINNHPRVTVKKKKNSIKNPSYAFLCHSLRTHWFLDISCDTKCLRKRARLLRPPRGEVFKIQFSHLIVDTIYHQKQIVTT